jgi:hypothetical protein
MSLPTSRNGDTGPSEKQRLLISKVCDKGHHDLHFRGVPRDRNCLVKVKKVVMLTLLLASVLYFIRFRVFHHFGTPKGVYIMTLFVTVSALMILTDNPSEESHKKPGICTTPECIHASSEILYNLSPKFETIDPCTNFEELVCGGWSDRHDLRPDQGDAFTGTIMSETSETLLRHILEAPYPKNSMVSFLFQSPNGSRRTGSRTDGMGSTPTFHQPGWLVLAVLSTKKILTSSKLRIMHAWTKTPSRV